MIKLSTRCIEICYNIAKEYHAEQLDKGGNPYIEHPVAVAEKLDTELEKCVALLHDVIEDTDLTSEDLLRMGVPSIVVEKVLIVTHNPNEPYNDYIKRVAKDPVAINVKLADIEHNMDLSRIPNVSQRDLDRVENKYRKNYEYLKEIKNKQMER